MLLQKSCFQFFALKHRHSTRWYSDTFETWWDL